jgi:hypothetical protein
MWEDMSANANADAYDRNLRWMANHPWIQVVALDEALNGETVNRDLRAADGSQAQDWVHHAANRNYDNWYFGSARHEGLAPKLFEVRFGTNLPSGVRYGSMTNGLLSNAWKTVRGLTNAAVRRLAQQNPVRLHLRNRLPPGGQRQPGALELRRLHLARVGLAGLAGLRLEGAGQTRLAALYGAVDDWANRTLGDRGSRGRRRRSRRRERIYPAQRRGDGPLRAQAAAGWSAPGARAAPTSSR